MEMRLFERRADTVVFHSDMKISHIPKDCGVYQIVSPTGAYYIGRSENMYRRMLNHLSDARKGKHCNLRLQRAFDKYGKRMKCEVLGIASKDDLAYLETYYIALFFKDGKCMNTAIQPVKSDTPKSRGGTEAYCVTYWTREIYRVPSMQGWAKEMGKCLTWRGAARQPSAQSKFAIFQSRDECEAWLQNVDSKVIASIELELCPPVKTSKPPSQIKTSKPPSQIELDAARQKRIERIYKWGYHVRHESGRATLARDTYELSQYKIADGWSRRRFNDVWREPKIGTPPKPVIGTHPQHGTRWWASIGACARDLQRVPTQVIKACTGKQRTTAEWTLKYEEAL
jgi:hypothetical protein